MYLPNSQVAFCSASECSAATIHRELPPIGVPAFLFEASCGNWATVTFEVESPGSRDV